MTLRWEVFADASAVSVAAADYIATCSATVLRTHATFRLVLAGGRTPLACYERLRTLATDWSRWEFFFTDERCVPRDDPARNSRAARAAWLDHVPLSPAQIHEIPAELGTEAACALHAPSITRAVPFALVILGVGEDGHTASLFPGRALDPMAWLCAVTDAPKPPPTRVSLGLRALRATAETLVLACGADKAAACRDWQAGELSPIARATAGQAGRVFIDRAAQTG